METDKTNYTTDTTADGREYVSEMSSVHTETLADGTQVVGDVTYTADPDDPTKIEAHGTITEIAPDGTEKVTEVITNEDGTFIVEEESAAEEMIEAVLGVEIDDNLTQIRDADGKPVSENAETADEDYEILETSEFETSDADFAAGGGDPFVPSAMPADESWGENSYAAAEPVPFDSSFGGGAADQSYSAAPFSPAASSPADSPFETTPTDYYAAGTTDDGNSSGATTPEADAELLDQQAHAEAAREAQASADEFIAEGDYAAAAEAREVAENEAWEAGDSSMLGTSDSSDLDNAAYQQEQAEYYNEQQAEYAQAGDYEAAREASGNAAYHTGEADFLAGGDDHTGQAEAEEAQMEWAVYHQDIAEDNAQSAADYAADGDFETASIYAESASEAQGMADYHGDMGEHGGDLAVYDPSSDVASGGSYESTYDAGTASTYDTGIADVDTGFDSSMDMSSTDTGYDSGMDDV